VIWIKFHRQGTRLQNSTAALTSQIALKVPGARCAFVAGELVNEAELDGPNIARGNRKRWMIS
jgi:hypothetical protein